MCAPCKIKRKMKNNSASLSLSLSLICTPYKNTGHASQTDVGKREDNAMHKRQCTNYRSSFGTQSSSTHIYFHLKITTSRWIEKTHLNLATLKKLHIFCCDSRMST